MSMGICEGFHARGAASLVKTGSMVEIGRMKLLKLGPARVVAVNDLTKEDERGTRVSRRNGSIEEILSQKCLEYDAGSGGVLSDAERASPSSDRKPIYCP